MTTAEKNMLAKDINKADGEPRGIRRAAVAGTAAMQKERLPCP
jgi:hypothetical protein